MSFIGRLLGSSLSLDDRTHARVGTPRTFNATRTDILLDRDSGIHVQVGRNRYNDLDTRNQGPQLVKVVVKDEEAKAQRMSLEACKMKAQRDYKKMEASVEKWQVSEEEQIVRNTLPYVLKLFHGRVSTVTPLIVASKATQELEKSVRDLREKQGGAELIDSYKEPLNSSSYDIARGTIHKTLDPTAEWKDFFLIQIFTNEKEAPVTHAKQKDLIAEARIWETKQRNNDFVIPTDIGLRNQRKDLFQRKAIWNVYSRIVLNMTLTAGTVYSLFYIRNGSSRR